MSPPLDYEGVLLGCLHRWHTRGARRSPLLLVGVPEVEGFASEVELFDSDDALVEDSFELSLAAALSLPSLLPSTPEDLRA